MSRRRVVVDDDWRTLRMLDGTVETRVSRETERTYSDEAQSEREQQLDAEQAERDAELDRAVLHALRAVERVRELLGDDRREAARGLSHHARRLLAQLAALRQH